MRTTLEINDELLREAKKRASLERTTLRALVERALRHLLGQPGRKSGYQLEWRVERGRLMPGVKIEDRDSLFDAMERRQ